MNTGGVRPAARDRRGRPRERRLAARRWRVRAVGGRRSRRGATSSRGWGTPTRGRPTPTSGSTCRTTPACRSCRRRGAPRRDDARGRVLRRDDRRRARQLQLGARVVAAGPRVRGLGGAAAARPRRARGDDRRGRRTTPGGSPAGWRDAPAIRVLNDVVLNQVLVRFDDPSGDVEAGDARTDAVIAAVQARRHAVARRDDAGTGCARCASRSAAGPRRRPTSTPRWRSSAASPTRSGGRSRRVRPRAAPSGGPCAVMAAAADRPPPADWLRRQATPLPDRTKARADPRPPGTEDRWASAPRRA